MAGGKETPRQKMIGMMYLVLTALLALNVAKTILDAFVAIEENIQLANINEVGRGDEKIDLIKDKAEGNEKSDKAIYVYKMAQEIDKVTAEQIQLIDQAKLLVLMECKEDIKTAPEADEKAEAIVVLEKDRTQMKLDLNPTKPGVKNNPFPIRPIRMNLHHVEGKDKYDEGMRVMGIASDEGLLNPDPKKHGAMIWNGMKNYRNFLCNKVVEVSNYVAKLDTLKDKKGKLIKFSFSTPSDDKVKEFKNKGELLAILEPNLKSFIVDQSPVDEYSVIKDVYIGLTKSQLVKEGEKSLHWIGKTFDHAPSVAVLASLSSIQKDILSARSVAISYLQGKVGAGEYSFNKVMALAYPDQAVVNGGEEFTMSVLMAAFDSERQPVVNPEQGTAMAARQGVGIVKLRAPNSGEMKLTGTVTIRKKNGQEKTERYETKVVVVPPMGTVTLPEFSIMYRGYSNKVTAIAGGSKGESTISVVGASSVPSTFNVNGQNYKGWLVKPGAGNSVTVTVNGKDSQGNSKAFGKFTYKVKPFPLPQVMTTKISKSAGARLVVSLGPDCPIGNVNFAIKGGEVQAGDGVSFSGAVIPGSSVSRIKVGKRVGVTVTVTNSVTGKLESISGTLTVGP
jgi:LEA14-like dessication related protein